MSNLTDKQNKLIRKAYEGYLKYIDSKEQKIKYENLTNSLDEFKNRLRTWKSNDSIDFIIDFAISSEAKVFAADGMARIFTSDFKEFMDMPESREKLEKMLFYKFNEEDNIQKYSKILIYDIRHMLDRNDVEFQFKFGRPKLLTGRLLLMIFTELFTTIADEISLNDACRKLDIKFDKNTKYLVKQRQIRYMVDTFLKENNLYDEVSELGRASIAWWIAVG
jgi:hypothetical protein